MGNDDTGIDEERDDSDEQYEKMRDDAGDILEDGIKETIKRCKKTIYYRNSNTKLAEHLIEAIMFELKTEIKVIGEFRITDKKMEVE
jgi:hypothetical protein